MLMEAKRSYVGDRTKKSKCSELPCQSPSSRVCLTVLCQRSCQKPRTKPILVSARLCAKVPEDSPVPTHSTVCFHWVICIKEDQGLMQTRKCSSIPTYRHSIALVQITVGILTMRYALLGMRAQNTNLPSNKFSECSLKLRSPDSQKWIQTPRDGFQSRNMATCTQAVKEHQYGSTITGPKYLRHHNGSS